MSAISLTASMRSNLLSLQNIASQQDIVQNRLATGLKVSSAIDNPSSYYTASSLNNRAADLTTLLDAMSQGIQTIKAASETLEAGTKFLEQAKAVANQALETAQPVIARVSSEAELLAAIDSGQKGQIILKNDIILTEGLKITTDIILDGNGHKISYTAAGTEESVIRIDGVEASASIKNLYIEANGEKIYGIHVTNNGHLTLDTIQNINVSGTGAKKLLNGNTVLYDGKSNTNIIVKQLNKEALAGYAATQFYAPGTDKNGIFGQGNWYLPSMGELMDVYGTNPENMTNGYGTTGAVGNNKITINTALKILAEKTQNSAQGAIAAELTEGYYWSSSERVSNEAWVFEMTNGHRGYAGKADKYYVRTFLEVDISPFSSLPPKIGDIMYADLSYGSADNYDGSKTAVGIITAVSEDGTSAKIMNLKDLTFSSTDSANNFIADDPYGSTEKVTQLGGFNTDIDGLPNLYSADLLAAAQSKGTIIITDKDTQADININTNIDDILRQYDNLISDASYKGINLLNNQKLKVNFNEDRSSGIVISGVKALSTELGIITTEWQTTADIEKSISELEEAINILRGFASEFGNYYNIVTTREDFTENLINVLEEGVDKLTLADMNQESANMLALQTAQQLAVNSLSLASQASQAILKLF